MAAVELVPSPVRSVAERLADLERGMGDATIAVLELANVAHMQCEQLAALRRRQRWWNRAGLLFALLVLMRLLTACGGAPFESGSPAGSQLAGAQSSAGSQAAGASAGPSGGAGGVAGGNTAGNELGGAGGELGGSSSSAGTGDELGGFPSSSGAGGELGGSSSSAGTGGGAPCLRGWQGSACDTCTPSAPPASGETCAELLGCYLEHNGPANCDFVKPTADAVVKIAHDVLSCRGGCL
jgi:hypothetical protein